MLRMRNASALVLAAGTGSRLGLGPKAFLRLGGDTLLARVVDVLSSCVERILVGAPGDYLEIAHKEVGNRAEIYAGGSSRKETLQGLLGRCDEEIILIQDVDRPFVTEDLVMRVLAAAQEAGAATTFTEEAVPLVVAEDGYLERVISRFKGGTGETPNAFHRSAVTRALQYAAEHGIEDLVLFELLVAQGTPVRAIPSELCNIKITTPVDWEIAKRIHSLQSCDRGSEAVQ